MSMKIYEVRNILKARFLYGAEHLNDIVLAGGGADLMEDVLAAAAESAVLLTGLTTEQVLRTAKIAGIGCIVFVRGKCPPDNVLALARSYDLPVLSTRHSLFVASGLLYINGLRGLDGSW